MTMPRADTWMPMYWADYAGDTGHLNALKHGAYLMLIKHYWRTGGALKDDDDELWRIATCDSKKEWLAIRETIAAFFLVQDERWYHSRVDFEMNRAQDITNKRSTAGKASAKHKANKRSTNDQHINQQTGEQTAIPSQSPSQDSPKPPQAGASHVENSEAAEDQKHRRRDGANPRANGENPRANGRNPKAVVTADEAEINRWKSRLRGYEPGGFWQATWGNRPEEGGNPSIPASILIDWKNRQPKPA